MSNASNAIMAKIRSMYGYRFTEKDFLNLLNKKNESEIASFLQTKKLYADSLYGINVKAIHRGQLEVLLRTNIFQRISKLVRYMEGNGKHLVHHLISNTEIELLMMKIRTLSSGDALSREELITHMPLYFSEYSSFDFMQLSDVRNYEELLALIKNTAYYAVLKNYSQKPIEDLDFITLEHHLHRHMDEETMQVIAKECDKDTKDKMQEMIRISVELENIRIIYRLKKYFNASAEQILPLLSDQAAFIHRQTILDWINHLSADQILEELQKTRYKRYIGNSRFQYIEHFTKRIQYELSRHYIYQELNANILLFAYIHLSEIEIQNLIDIVEAVHYGISQEKIKGLLIY